MEPHGLQTRRAFLGRAVALGALVGAGSAWRAGLAVATKPPKLPSWTTAGNLTGALANPLYAVAADSLTKKTYFAKCDGNGAIQFAQSVDEGKTFAAFRSIAGITSASDVPLDRALVVDEVTKRVHLLYSAGADDLNQPASLLYIHSDDGGSSWSHPMQIDDGVSSTGMNHGTNRFIRVAMAARNGIVHIGWTSISNTTFLTDGLFYVRSADGGNTFSPPQQPFRGTVSPSRPDIATIGDTVLFTWTDARYGSAYNGNPGEIFVGRSTNGGSTWVQKRLTFTGKRWGAATALRPVICAGSTGTVTVVWQDPNSAPVGGAGGPTGHNSPGTENLYWIHSSDGGASWGRTGVLVHAASSQEHAYLAQRGDLVACAWSDWRSSPHQIRATVSTDGGATFGPAMQPMVSAADTPAPIIVASKDFFQVYVAEAGNGVFRARLPYRSIRFGRR